ncbi:MAG: ABC transporter substrate-binding protein [Fimbriimonadales bacterium]
MNQRLLLLSFAALIAATAISGCKTESGEKPPTLAERELPTAQGNKQEGDTIKIGVIASLNGEQQPWGIDSQRGSQLAVDQFNEAGGIDGKKVQLIIEDTGSKPEGGKSATEKLVGKDHVLAVVGEVASGITLPAADVCQENGVPLVAVGATRVDLTEKGGAIFRACFTDNFQGAAMAKFAYEDLKLRNVAILTDRKLPYSTGLSEVFIKAFKSFGGQVATEEQYESGTVDFTAQLTNIKAKKPDGLFCSGYFTEIGPIARQRQTVGLGDIPMFGGDGWDSTTLIEAGGAGVIGSYFLNHYHNSEKRAEVQDFVTNFKAKYGAEPATAMGALAYDATGVVLDALKRASSLDSKALITTISETKDFKGVSGNITIGADGNAEKPALVLRIEKTGFVAHKQIPFFRFEG